MQPFSRLIGQGPPQSNGMCLAEFSVYSNLKPCASTDRIVDFPQVTTCGPGPVSLPGAFSSCGYFPGGLVGPLMALAQALILPTISTPQWPRSGAIASAKGARAGYCAAAVVEPVADDMPPRNVAHPGPPIGCDAETVAGFAGAVRALLSELARILSLACCTATDLVISRTAAFEAL